MLTDWVAPFNLGEKKSGRQLRLGFFLAARSELLSVRLSMYPPHTSCPALHWRKMAWPKAQCWSAEQFKLLWVRLFLKNVTNSPDKHNAWDKNLKPSAMWRRSKANKFMNVPTIKLLFYELLNKWGCFPLPRESWKRTNYFSSSAGNISLLSAVRHTRWRGGPRALRRTSEALT